MQNVTAWLPFASLVVAALAVFVGPAINAAVARRQMSASLAAANKQIVGPMRQAWLNALRAKVAEVLSTAHWYNISNYDPTGPTNDGLAGARVEQRLLFLVQEIELMLNLAEADHQLLLAQLKAIAGAFYDESPIHGRVDDAVRDAGETCRRVLKREWDRVKADIALTGKDIRVVGSATDGRHIPPAV